MEPTNEREPLPTVANDRTEGERPEGKTLLLVGALVTAIGLAIAGTAPIRGTSATEDRTHVQSDAGGVLVLGGWVVLALGIHRFGRAGSR